MTTPRIPRPHPPSAALHDTSLCGEFVQLFATAQKEIDCHVYHRGASAVWNADRLIPHGVMNFVHSPLCPRFVFARWQRVADRIKHMVRSVG
jgi:hypothetical protein